MVNFKNRSSMVKLDFSNIVAIILIMYILSDTTIPTELFEVVNEPMIKIVLVATCIYVTMHKPLLGCLSLVAMYELMTRNNMLQLPSLFSSLVPSFSPALSPPHIVDSYVEPAPAMSTELSKFNNVKNASNTIYNNIDDTKTKIMNNFSANNTKMTLEEELVNGLVPYYNNAEEETVIQPILAKQPNKNCVRI